MNQTDASKILINNFEKAGQGQVFAHFDGLSMSERRALLEQAASIDLEEVNTLVQLHLKGGKVSKTDFSKLKPAPYTPLPANGGDAKAWDAARAAGEKALKAGEVAAFTVAGGQGTRLGFNGPKGTFLTSPVAKKSLFQLFAEKLQRASERYGSRIPWFIMTSQINHAETVGFFDQNGFFGLDPVSVHFFSQGLMPAVDQDGRILLAGKGEIAMSPDGHGGALRALVRSGAIDRMEREGIRHLSYFQVDNPLVQVIDPAFIGFHVLGQSELSSKMTPKAYAGEKVGHFCEYEGKQVVIEYSDLPSELAEEKTADGQLRFRAGSIAIHVFDRDFIKRLGGTGNPDTLPFHRADKKVKAIDAAGKPVEPEEANGVKFEMFVFDALPMAKQPVIIETAREDDFSPVKNAEGIDSVDTCRADLRRMYGRWLKAAGESVAVDETGLPELNFEISFRFACDESDFVKRWQSLKSKPAIADGVVLG